MNTAVMFSSAKDEWATPREFVDGLRDEFDFMIDAAATRENRVTALHFGPDSGWAKDALVHPWAAYLERCTPDAAVWMNPPYSKCRQFIAKAASEAQKGCTVVCLVPSRTDTRWWHEHVWDDQKHQPRPGVEVRFIKGRLKFGGSANSAPFPSVVVIFKPPSAV